MRRMSWLLLSMAMVTMVTGCGDVTPAHDPGASTPITSSAMEFRGDRPCADCNGIQAWLRLEQEGAARHFRMVEHYRGNGRERQFDDEGEWRADGDLLRLRSSNGGERVYARLADGALQARDAHGQPLPAAADDVMVPVTFDTVR